MDTVDLMLTSRERRLRSYEPRKDGYGRVELAFRCPVLCHGFGECFVCHGTLVVWRRPRPF